MPTPFTHLRYAQDLLTDPAVPAQGRALLNTERGAYLLGSVIADAHSLCGLKREDTHFYSFDRPMETHPWRVMMANYPALTAARDPAWRAFLAGYVMHLSMDEVWSLEMTGPEFADREWAPRPQRFVMLHVLLISLDERDLALLNPEFSADFRDVHPYRWLPFMEDRVLREWASLIHAQLSPGGSSETLAVYGPRIQKSPDELRAILDAPERMQADLWAHVTPETTVRVETSMVEHARAQMVAYLSMTS